MLECEKLDPIVRGTFDQYPVTADAVDDPAGSVREECRCGKVRRTVGNGKARSHRAIWRGVAQIAGFVPLVIALQQPVATGSQLSSIRRIAPPIQHGL
jgi:hypothetical protein